MFGLSPTDGRIGGWGMRSRRFRIEVRFADGRVSTARGVREARRLARAQGAPAEIWSVWPNDLGVGTRIDRVDPAQQLTR
jgi:hypothetical protein